MSSSSASAMTAATRSIAVWNARNESSSPRNDEVGEEHRPRHRPDDVRERGAIDKVENPKALGVHEGEVDAAGPQSGNSPRRCQGRRADHVPEAPPLDRKALAKRDPRGRYVALQTR